MRTKCARNWAVGGCGLLLAAALGCGPTLEQERLREIAQDGVVLFKQGRYSQAREDFEFVLQTTPNDANTLFNAGQCCDRMGELRKAEDYYQLCLNQNPKHALCRQAQARLLRDTDRRQQAEDQVEEWLRKEPELADAFALDGWRLRQDKHFEEAKGRLQQALNRDARNVLALTELGLLYEELEYPDRAIVLYERALQVTPHDEKLTERVKLLKSRGAGKPRPE
jgi:tetratricopeptide (TPR) repeat protein